MPVVTALCGCTFDSDFVAAEHNDTAPHHRLLQAAAVAKPVVDPEETPVEGLMGKVMGKLKKKDE